MAKNTYTLELTHSDIHVLGAALAHAGNWGGEKMADMAERLLDLHDEARADEGSE